MHPNMWYHLNAIRHHDGCRLVHPAKWDISSMPYAIMTVLIGASCQVGHWTILGCLRDGWRLVHPVRRFIRYNIQFIRFSNITFQFHIHFRIIFSKIYSIYVLISYTHSRTHFIYLFMYSFYILIHVLVSYTHSCTHFIFNW